MNKSGRFTFNSVSWFVGGGMGFLVALALALAAIGFTTLRSTRVQVGRELDRIVTSLRADRSGKKYLRLSPHFYNTDAELHRVLEML